MPDERWHAFPGISAPKVWIGPQDRIANGLLLYAPSSWLGRGAQRVLRAMPERVARWILPSAEGSAPPGLSESVTVLRRLYGDERLGVSVATGTPGPHRKVTAQITSSAGVLAYAKIGQNSAVTGLLDRERDAIAALAGRTDVPFEFPRLIYYESTGTYTMLVQSPAPTRSGRVPPLLTRDHLTLLEWLSSTKAGRISSAAWRAQYAPSNTVDPEQTPMQRATLSNAIEFVDRTFRDDAIRTSFCHGDYAPWNMRCTHDGRLFLFDWEYAHPSAPLLHDLAHFLFMPAYLVRRLEARELVGFLLERFTSDLAAVWLRKLDVSTDDVQKYLLLYLLTIFFRGREGRPPTVVLDCIHHLLVRVGYQPERPRVLVAAYACEPAKGSEPGVGWNMALAIASHQEAWVVTRSNNQPAIERAMESSPHPHLHFLYVDLPRWASFWKKGGRGIRTYYYLWQLLAWRRARKVCQRMSFDLSHHVTFVNDWMFTFLALLDIPFVWGPIGSNPKMPSRLAVNRRAVVGDVIRHLIQRTLRLLDPLYWLTIRRVSRVIGIHPDVASRFPLCLVPRNKWRFHTAIGADVPHAPRVAANAAPARVRIVSAGHLLPIKGFHLTVRAFARFAEQHPAADLVIVGDGSQQRYLETLAVQLGVRERVQFEPWLPREQFLRTLQEAHLFLFPSFEGGGMVVLEAMASGLPVVCLDYGGPGHMVTSSCGTRVTPTNLQETVSGLASALSRYARNPMLTRTAGQNGILHVHRYHTWQRRRLIVAQWYREVLTRHDAQKSNTELRAPTQSR